MTGESRPSYPIRRYPAFSLHPTAEVRQQHLDNRLLHVYALALTAGQTLTVNVTANDPDYRVLLAPPGSAPFAGHLDALHGVPLCDYGQSCQQRFAVATSGTYGLVLAAEVAAIQYTLQATAK